MLSRKRTFYVYEHWRPDLDICFWVGKGKRNRAFKFKRNGNPHYNRIVAKLSRLGMCVEVRMVASGMTERAALALEIERIAFWRSAGVALANITDGGQGTSGIVYGPERRAMISAFSKGRKHTEETRARMRVIALSRAPANPKVRKQIGKSVGALWTDPEYRNRIQIAHANRPPITEETRVKMIAGQQGRGKTRPSAHKAAISASIKLWHAKRKAALEGAS